MKIITFVKKQASVIMNEIDKQGYILGGKNGPYDDNETPVRVTAHWIQIFSWLYSQEKDEKYIAYIQKMADYLYDLNVAASSYSFCCRNKVGKDHVNGTIGQAWVIEGLVEASRVLSNDKYYDLAVQVFLNHEFNFKTGCWNRFEIDGTVLGYDGTFNHQLWLAASGAVILEYKDHSEIRKQITCFLDQCLKNHLFHIHSNGTICHYCCTKESFYQILYYHLREWKQKIYGILKKPNMRYKEEGYHYFALYGFAMLYHEFQNHSVFKSAKLRRAISYAIDEKNYQRQLNVDPKNDGTGLASKIGGKYNIYCFPYNSPAFLLPYIIKTFLPEQYDVRITEEMWKLQEEICLDDERNLSLNTNDSITLTARIYELLRALR